MWVRTGLGAPGPLYVSEGPGGLPILTDATGQVVDSNGDPTEYTIDPRFLGPPIQAGTSGDYQPKASCNDPLLLAQPDLRIPGVTCLEVGGTTGAASNPWLYGAQGPITPGGQIPIRTAATPGQWIAGIPNNYVLIGGGLLAMFMMSQR